MDWPEITNWESSLKINSFHCGPVLTTPLPWEQCSAGQCVMVSMRLPVWSEFGMCVTFSGYLCKCSPRGADERLHVPVSCLSQLAGEILIHRQTWSYHSRTGNAHESQVVLTFSDTVRSCAVLYLPSIPWTSDTFMCSVNVFLCYWWHSSQGLVWTSRNWKHF